MAFVSSSARRQQGMIIQTPEAKHSSSYHLRSGWAAPVGHGLERGHPPPLSQTRVYVWRSLINTPRSYSTDVLLIISTVHTSYIGKAWVFNRNILIFTKEVLRYRYTHLVLAATAPTPCTHEVCNRETNNAAEVVN